MQEEKLARALGWFSIGLGLVEVAVPEKLSRGIGIRDRETLIRLYGVREILNGIGLLAQRGPGKPAGWVWARVGGDLLDLATLLTAPTENGDRKRVGMALGTVGAITVLDALYAGQLSQKEAAIAGITADPGLIRRSITIGRSAEELYSRWRDPQTLAQIMAHFADVTVGDKGRIHWRLNSLPLGQTLEWDTQTVQDRPVTTPEQGYPAICWEATPDTPVPNSGAVHFRPAPGNRGTEVTLTFRFIPPAGPLEATASRWLDIVPETLATKALRRFKSLVEAGEIPVKKPQPAARPEKD